MTTELLAVLVAASLVLSVFVSRKVSDMSQSTDALAGAVASLTVQVAAVAVAVGALKANQADPADTAKVDQAVSDVQAAVGALAAAIA